MANRFTRKRLNQTGAVSLISVLLFTLIITVLTLAYMQSAIRQQKNALNYDFSTRAYYAAEAGAQDAIRGMGSNPASKTSCTPFTAGGNGVVGQDDFGLRYTCQLITVNPSEMTGQLNAGETAMLQLNPSATPAPSGPYRLEVRWSLRAGEVRVPREVSEPVFPSYDQWNESGSPLHALLRVGVISARKVNPTKDTTKQRVIFLNPTSLSATAHDDGAFTGGSPVFSEVNDDILPQQETLVNNAACFPSNSVPVSRPDFGSYSCKRTIILSGYDLNSQAIYVRVGAIYEDTNFSITLTRQAVADRTAIPMRNSQAVVDVTGSAYGEMFRRIQQRVSLGGYVKETGPDAALIAGEGICKQFSLTETIGGYRERCNPLAPQ